MSLITHSTRFPVRCLALAGIAAFTLIGLAGARNTVAYWNEQKSGQLTRSSEATAEQERALAAIEAKELELAGQAKLAEGYSELGIRQANCGDTLSQFYFSPGGNIVEQLNVWGLDWQTPRYNTDKWFPLFDSAGLLFAAVRGNPAGGMPEIVTADQQKLDQASICNLNQLSTEN